MGAAEEELKQLNRKLAYAASAIEEQQEAWMSAKNDQQRATLKETWQQLVKQQEALLAKRNALYTQLWSSGQEEEDFSSVPLYSKTLAEDLNIRTPLQQYYFYISTVSALGVTLCQTIKGVYCLGRVKEMGRAALLKKEGRPMKEWIDHIAEADATEIQVYIADKFISRQRTTARVRFAAAAAAPLLWLSYVAYRRMSVPAKKLDIKK